MWVSKKTFGELEKMEEFHHEICLNRIGELNDEISVLKQRFNTAMELLGIVFLEEGPDCLRWVKAYYKRDFVEEKPGK